MNIVQFPPVNASAQASPMAMLPAIDHYIDRILARGLALNTANAYRNDLSHYVRFVQHGAHGDLVCVQSARTVSRFLDDQQARGIAKRSQARRLSALRMFFRHAMREGWIGHDPTRDEYVRFQPEFVIAPELEQFHQVIAAIPRSGPWHLRDRAMLRVMLETGLRISALCALDAPGFGTPTSIDMQRGLVFFIGKGGRPSSKPINEVTRRMLEDWLAVRIDVAPAGLPAMFTTARCSRISRGSAHDMIKRRGRACGLELHAHLFRHRRGAHVLENCGDKAAQNFLDHSSLTTTSTYGQRVNTATLAMLRERADIDAGRVQACG